MKNAKKKLSAIVVAIMTTASLSAPAFAVKPANKNSFIETLLSRHNSISLSIKENGDLGLDTSALQAEEHEIDKQLSGLGVESLTTEEVLERFGENDAGIMPYVLTPKSDNIYWYTWRSTVTTLYDRYEVQTLTASVKGGKPSKLLETGAVVLQNKKNWKAGALKVLGLTGKKGVTYLLNQNSVTKIAKNAYDYAKAYIKGLSAKTVITNVRATYSYNAYTTASFKYVKKDGDPDSSQRCTYISTKCEVALHGSFPTFVCKNGINHPKIVTFDETIIASPNTFNNNMAAVNAFRSPFAPTRAYLNGIDLYGLENKKLVTVGALRPEFIAYLA